MNSFRKAVVSAALMGGAVLGGAVGASMIGTANAQTSTDSTSSSAPATAPADPSGTQGQPPRDHGNGGPHTANGITEQPLTGDDLTRATDAANGAVPGATIDRAETDAEGAAYEVHMTKADGSRVTVKLNADFSVANVEDGM